MQYPLRDKVLRAGAAIVAAAIGAACGLGVFLLVLFFPAFFTREDVMLLWGWFGTPLGLVFGFAAFLVGQKLATKVIGRWTPPFRVTKEFAAKHGLPCGPNAVPETVALALTEFRSGQAVTHRCPCCGQRLVIYALHRQKDQTSVRCQVECRCGACNEVVLA